MEKVFHYKELDYKVILGKYARQADGAVWFEQGGTVVFATVVSAPSQEFPGFLPLMVDYRENFSAAGRIPGGYLKREGKSSDQEVLTGRLIDRSLRPLFPQHFFDQVQILINVYSVDKEHTPHIISLIAASLALSISKIPFDNPVGAVEVARVDNKWVYQPTYDQAKASDVKLIVAGTHAGIAMVEGSMQELSEDELIEIMFKAHEHIKGQVAWQQEIKKSAGVPNEPITEYLNWDEWQKKSQQFLTDDLVKSLFLGDKVARSEAIDKAKTDFMQMHQEAILEQVVPEKVVKHIFAEILKNRLTEMNFMLGKRIDGRNFEQVRDISIEVGILPSVHGSSIFTRGQTQALTSVTLGGGQDAQKVDVLMDEMQLKKFMLHYNFPPSSVGEVRPMRGAGRREIGHGYLARSAIMPMLPTEQEFPYTMRIVADMLESNGSTSMATVCGSTMALMQAGVPIKKMVSGIAMGLLRSSDGSFQALTDINGDEDSFGLMDFKVAGTDTGITAIQMDIKDKKGLPPELFQAALEQAKRGRLHILHEMRKCMTEPNKELSSLVPRIVSFTIPTDKIGAVIGSGGKVIREIIDKTGTSIDIDDDGVVKIYGHLGPNMDQAIKWAKTLGGLIDKGEQFEGAVKRVADFGLFVEIAPGQDGLVHISAVPREQQRTMNKEYPVGTLVKVEVMDYDKVTGRIRLKLI